MIFKKKGQMEIAGLVVIVILLSLGMLFLAYFSLSERDQEKIFTRKNLAASTMASIMKTTSSIDDCGDQLSFEKDILEDCAANKHLDQDHAYGIHCLNNMVNSCDYLEDRIGKILKQTLGYLKKSYDFSAILLTEENLPLIFIKSEKGCDKGVGGERDQTTYYLNTAQGNVLIRLRVCE